MQNLITFYEARELVGYDDFAHVDAWLAHGLARPPSSADCRSRRAIDGLAYPCAGIRFAYPGCNGSQMRCFTAHCDVSEHDTLAATAGGAGLSDRAREILASDTNAAPQRGEAQQVFSAPAVIINQTHPISGGQPVEVFERALREVVAGGQ